MSTIPKVSVSEYDKMIAAGVFDGPGRRRVELLNGEIQDMSPIGPSHEYLVDRLNRWSFDVVQSKDVLIRIQNSIGLPELDSVPEPDVVWVRDREYFEGRPTVKDVLLVIEVAPSSLDKDRGEKASIYASARIADYWVVHVEDRLVEVFRDAGRGRFRSVTNHGESESIQPLAFADISLSVGELFRRKR